MDIALAECLNVIWKHTNLFKDLDPKEASLAIEDLTKLYDDLSITPTRELKDQAMHIAITQNITVYDALFIAAAQKINATLYTADKKLCAKTDQTHKIKTANKRIVDFKRLVFVLLEESP